MDGGIFSHWWFACIWGNLDIKHTTLESFLQWKRIRHEDMVSNAFAGHTYVSTRPKTGIDAAQRF